MGPNVLKGITAAELRQLAINCGVSSSGTKPQIFQRLVTAKAARPLGDLDLVSVDMGLKNIGVSFISSKHDKLSVNNLYLDHIEPTSAVADLASEALQLTDRLCRDMGTPTVVLIERQRSRTASSASIPPAILRVNVLEGMLHAVVRAKYPSIYTESVDPKSILGFWREPGSTVKKTYSESKKLRTKLVGTWLHDDAPFSMPTAIKEDFEREIKRDDLCDSLVQGVSWFIWRKNLINASFLANLDSTSYS